MKTTVFTISFILLSFFQIVQASEWYIGGTLHQSKISYWRNASSRNKLATCSDFVAKIPKGRRAAELHGMGKLREMSYEVMVCIDTIAVKRQFDNYRVSEVAALCITELGYY